MNKCDVTKCHAACCYNIPLEKGYLSAYRKKIVNPVIRLEQLNDSENYRKEKLQGLGRNQYLVFTDNDPAKNKCPFLREDCKCNIYEQRPVICRRYGTKEDVMFLNCKFLTGKENVYTQENIDKSVSRIAEKIFLKSK